MTRERLLYAVCVALGLLLAYVLRRPSPLRARERWALALAALFGSALAAKLPFVLLEGGLLSPAAWLGDGKTILTGLAGGYLAVEAAKRVLGIRAKTGDGLAVPLAAAVAAGRWGCWFNGCCSAPGHPVPLYESAFHGAMAFCLWRLESVEALRFQFLKLYLLAYCAFRFGIEYVRIEPRVAFGLTAYQIGALLLAALMAVLWARDERLKRRELTSSLPSLPDSLAPRIRA